MARSASVDRDAAAIFGGGVQVGNHFDVRRAPRSARRRSTLPSSARAPCSASATESSRSGTAAAAPMPIAARQAAAVVVERDLRRGRHEGEIALAGVDLVKADADRPLRPHRKAHRRSGRPPAAARSPSARGRNPPAAISTVAAALAPQQRGAERRRHQHDLGRRIAVGERAADGAARARRGVADERHDLGEQRQLRAHHRIALDRASAWWWRRSRPHRPRRGRRQDPECARCRSAASAARAASPSAAPASGRPRSGARRRRRRAARRLRRCWPAANIRTGRVSFERRHSVIPGRPDRTQVRWGRTRNPERQIQSAAVLDSGFALARAPE